MNTDSVVFWSCLNDNDFEIEHLSWFLKNSIYGVADTPIICDELHLCIILSPWASEEPVTCFLPVE